MSNTGFRSVYEYGHEHTGFRYVLYEHMLMSMLVLGMYMIMVMSWHVGFRNLHMAEVLCLSYTGNFILPFCCQEEKYTF
jgi:hypothetical protein